jgi:hypothetical protein
MSDVEVINQALAMPRALRVKLLEQLLATLDYDEDFDVPQHVIDDASRISEAIDRGEMKTYPWREALQRLHEARHAKR